MNTKSQVKLPVRIHIQSRDKKHLIFTIVKVVNPMSCVFFIFQAFTITYFSFNSLFLKHFNMINSYEKHEKKGKYMDEYVCVNKT